MNAFHRFVALAVLVVPALVSVTARAQVTLESLLTEMTDRGAVARFPIPAYTCKQFSSYDRASTSKDNPATWFANDDQGQYLRSEQTQGRTENVMAEMSGPGAIVRIWTPNPKGTLRIYLDGDPKPVIETRMQELLEGKSAIGRVKIEEPIATSRSRGWNLYLPIPYQTSCKVTTDEGPIYYHINYRTYDASTKVETLSASILRDHADTLALARDALLGKSTAPIAPADPTEIAPGSTQTLTFSAAGSPGQAIDGLAVLVDAKNIEQALRSTVIIGEFDGQQTIWCPLADFFGSGVGLNVYTDRYRSVTTEGLMTSRFVMPFAKAASITFKNLGDEPIKLGATASLAPWRFDDRSMHFAAVWRTQNGIPTVQAAGSLDWNYVTIAGKGVYVGDNLAIMNPVLDWWGEGDEKIYVDGEKFPSHFGTGTEDYYGYGWCDSRIFNTPFVSQVRCDGNGRSNYGYSCVTRVRALDAIPFNSGLDMNIEVWHWIKCEVAYATTSYFYARPGFTTNRTPDEAGAKAPVPQPPPLPPVFTMPGAIECETLTVSEKSGSLTVSEQPLDRFGVSRWSNNAHLWCRGTAVGEFIELKVPAPAGKHTVVLHATRSWDYATVQFALNGTDVGKPVDFYSGGEMVIGPTGPIELGVAESKDGFILLRSTLVGKNAAAQRPGTFFGLDAVVLTPAK
ncbi:MAG: DUF2961 domain-containing protein [Tepidisphaera sp.]